MDAMSRAQSETVGVLLLTAVFVILASVFGLFVLASVMSGADDGPLVDVEANATAQYVTLHHAGGESLGVTDVDVIVEGESRQEYDLASFDRRTGPDDGRFEPGDAWRGPNEVGGDSLEVTVVDESSNQIVDTITVTVDVDVVARVSHQPRTPAPGATITFDASASEVRGGILDGYEWDFDADGVVDATGETVQHDFDATGTYPVELRVTTADGRSASTTGSVSVESGQPTATFTYSPTNPSTQDAIAFDGSASSGGGVSIASYDWEFGDGSTATGAQPTHSFDDDGSYDVTLTVTNDAGATVAETQTVDVENVEPTVAFDTYLGDGPGNEITYDASASSDPDGTIERYEWDIDGDGDVEVDTTEPVVDDTSWFDPQRGEVTLTVTDDDGATAELTKDDEFQPTPGFEVFAVVVAVLLGAGLRRRGYL